MSAQLVIGSDVPRRPGEVVQDIIERRNDPTSQLFEVPFCVLREATVEEWIASQTERGQPPSGQDIATVRILLEAGMAFLYAVSVD